ncbi:MAG: hypothetical protein M3Q65_04465, partial [Chloroflexota bacterium]|nr:hypothetical protein [Chloroflexota bacterium]
MPLFGRKRAPQPEKDRREDGRQDGERQPSPAANAMTGDGAPAGQAPTPAGPAPRRVLPMAGGAGAAPGTGRGLPVVGPGAGAP